MQESKPVLVRSATNPRIRQLVRLRDNRARRKANCVLVDGWRETNRAAQAGLTIQGLFVAESALDEPLLRRLDPQLSKSTLVSDALLQQICYGDSPRGIVAVFDRPTRSLEQLCVPACPLLLILDRIEKPGNVGAIFRSADAVGIDALLLCESADVFNPNAIRNSLGSVFEVPFACGDEAELGQFLIDRQITPIAARVESSTPLWETDLGGPLAIIVGSEAHGLHDRWRWLCGGSANESQQRPAEIQGVRIPMHGSGDSLNVSTSAAVILYEAARQRRA
jgi:TrmH family RNA methyltransferase